MLTKRLFGNSARFGFALACFGVAMAGCGPQTAENNSDSSEPAPTDNQTEEVEPEVAATDNKPAWMKDFEAKKNENTDLPDDAPVVKLTVTELREGRPDTTPEELEKELQGKWVEFTGVVREMAQRGISKALTVYISEKDQPHDLFQFQAPPTEGPQKVNIGDEVTYRGVWSNFKGMHNTKVVSGGTPAPQFTATELAQQYLDDPEKTKADLAGKHIIVTGKVQQARAFFKQNSDIYFGTGHIAASLEGKESTAIAVKNVAPYLGEMYNSVQVGDEIKVFGKVEIRDGQTDETPPFVIGLDDAMRVFE